MNKTLSLISIALASLLFVTSSYAESLVDGVYYSSGDENGQAACELTIASFDDTQKYGDELFKIESSGDGACEWSAIGISKNFSITAGSVTSGGAAIFVKLAFPFGPAGKRIQLTSFDADGSLRNEETFIQSEEDLLIGE